MRCMHPRFIVYLLNDNVTMIQVSKAAEKKQNKTKTRPFRRCGPTWTAKHRREQSWQGS